MQLTLLYRSKKTRFIYSMSLKRLVSIALLLFSVVLVSSRDTQLPAEQMARIAASQTGLQQQAEQLKTLKQQTSEQLQAMLDRLSLLQAKINQLDKLGLQLAQEAGLNSQEFQLASSQQAVIDETLLQQIDQAIADAEQKQTQLTALESILSNHHIEQQAQLTGRPIQSGWLSSYYGMREDPFNGTPAMHKGIDFAGKEGESVIATGAGMVTWAGERYGYGNLVEIDHGNGLSTRYGHNQTLLVKIGDVVTKGQVIAQMGNTGRSTGAHVHYEVISKGQQIDPLPYVYRKP